MTDGPTLEAVRPDRSRAVGIAKAWGRRALCTIAFVGTAGLVLLAAFAAAGRMRVVPVGAQGSDVKISGDALVMLEPVPVLQLKEGDVFLARPRKDSEVMMFRITSLDSWTHAAVVRDPKGRQVTMHLGNKAWRLSGTVPYGGALFRLLVGPIQSGLLILAGLIMIAKSEAQRRRDDPTASPAHRRRFRRSSRGRRAGALASHLR